MENKLEIYKTSGGAEISVKLEDETIWLDAHLIAELFELNRPAIVKHINNIYKSGELKKKTTCSILEQVSADGKKRKNELSQKRQLSGNSGQINRVNYDQSNRNISK